ncbi:hypothetical protein [Deinococcus radiophilus]|uniref:hypothetical protein n=1 Tax=Deinococcus radiophilus TaxID=32062 RepID=UPI003617AEB2
MAGAWRRLNTSRPTRGHWYMDDRLTGETHLLTERELRLHRLRAEQPSYQRYAD